ncbi:hypothetical protein Ddye_030653 [Dipteronia dyeriana]|uniref:RNase H type-1 domain-containing protein n=1 Tax=Dipteronia dyeriana TaxID=168575 RepID=A0AAD9TH32_9ROSI|nr:hypothetical protein Ddye_030653 [Dipteronia dyeriana]
MESGLFPKEIESDAATVVRWISEPRQVESEMVLVIEVIILAIQQLSCRKVKYVPRRANFVPHNLAKLSLSIDEDRVWQERSTLLVLGKVCRMIFLAACNLVPK